MADWTDPENDEPAEDVVIDSRTLAAVTQSPVEICPRCGQPSEVHGITEAFGSVCTDYQPASSPLPYHRSYADAPTTIGELRAKREHSAAQWDPRDALVNLLREIDAGETKVSALVVTFAVEHEDGSLGHGFRNACPDNFTALGLLARAGHRLQE